MKLQMAPMEGITTYIYRNAHARHFGKMDKYYTPFLSLHREKEFNHKEKQEILPKNNEGLNVVPQVLTNSAEDFLVAAQKLNDLGYEEVNINIGCPSGTVTAKGKGAGMLAEPERLQRFLEGIFEKTPVDISIKTRIGMVDGEEWENLLSIYNQYPIKELTVHARVREDYYKNPVNLKAFAYAMENSKNPLCYNGDVLSVDKYRKMKGVLSDVNNIMLGRGLIANPFLAEEIYKEGESDQANVAGVLNRENYLRLQAFHEEVYTEYQKVLSGDQNVLFKMKELWAYMIEMWPDAKKQHKQICKSRKCSEYETAVKELLFTKS